MFNFDWIFGSLYLRGEKNSHEEKIMKTVCSENQCAGCMACVDICPENAIRVNDDMDAYNAFIDETMCINCNACHNVCQNNNKPDAKHPLYWFEGWTNNIEQRKKSSSGGLATAIEQSFMEAGGIVCSCTFDRGKFRFAFADNKADLEKFIGSKYIKSNPEGIYKRIKDYVKEKRKVLFVGLPCQVAAVKNYIKDNTLLYTIDLICHGTPSPLVLESFLADYDMKLGDIKRIGFRDKTNFRLTNDNRNFTVPTVGDSYTMTFLDSTSYTENCYSCKYAQLTRVSDITLGDSWGSELSEDIQSQGISLVLCQTEKGWELLNKSNLTLLPVNKERAVALIIS